MCYLSAVGDRLFCTHLYRFDKALTRSTQLGAREWKYHISIRSMDEERHKNVNERTRSRGAAEFLCYSCHTMLTSRSPRSFQANDSISFPLPAWSCSIIDSYQEHKLTVDMESREMSRREMGDLINDYII